VFITVKVIEKKVFTKILKNWDSFKHYRLNIEHKHSLLRSEVLTAVLMKLHVFWDMTPC